MRRAQERLVGALQAAHDTSGADLARLFRPALVTRVVGGAVSVTVGLTQYRVSYPVGMSLVVGDSVVLVSPPEGTPFIGWHLTGTPT